MGNLDSSSDGGSWFQVAGLAQGVIGVYGCRPPLPGSTLKPGGRAGARGLGFRV